MPLACPASHAGAAAAGVHGRGASLAVQRRMSPLPLWRDQGPRPPQSGEAGPGGQSAGPSFDARGRRVFQSVSCWPVPPWQRRGQVDPRCRTKRRNALPGRGCGTEWTERRYAGRRQGAAVPRDVISAAQPVRHAHGSRPGRALPRVARQQNLRARAAKRHFFSRGLSDKEVEVRHGAAGLERIDDEDKPQTGLSRPISARRERRRDAARGPVPS